MSLSAKYGWLIGLLGGLYLLACQPKPPASNSSSSTFKQEIGDQHYQTLTEAQMIVLYLLDPERRPQAGEAVFQKYAVIDQPITLSKKETTQLRKKIKAIIDAPDPEPTSSCPFIPDFGLRFYDQNKTGSAPPTDLLVSFFCNQLMIRKAGKVSFQIFDTAMKSELEKVYEEHTSS